MSIKESQIIKNKVNSQIFVLLCVSVVVLFAPMFQKLFVYGWKNADYDHGVFILPIALYVIWQKRDSLRLAQELKGGGVLGLCLGLAVYLYAFYNDFLFLQVLAFIGILSGLFYVNLTKDSLKHVVFPLTYPLFMVPPPGLLIDAVTIHLKEVSIDGAYWVLKTINIPVQVQGLILKVADTPLLITEACSGYRSIVTLCALGAVYAYSQHMTFWKKWLVFAMVLPLGIAGNIIRIVITGLIALRFGEKYAEGFFHDSSNVVVFACTVLGLMLFSKLIRNKEGL